MRYVLVHEAEGLFLLLIQADRVLQRLALKPCGVISFVQPSGRIEALPGEPVSVHLPDRDMEFAYVDARQP